MKNWKEVEIPFRMKELPKDKSGFPIPFTIKRDVDGNAYFKQHDVKLLAECIINKQCSICGKPLKPEIWLLAGAKTAVHPQGAYIDPPMHRECATYALKVCPYLAQPSFLKRSPNEVNESAQAKIFAGKPVVFALVKTFDFRLQFLPDGAKVIIPLRPFIEIEFWKDGQQISPDEAKMLIQKS